MDIDNTAAIVIRKVDNHWVQETYTMTLGECNDHVDHERCRQMRHYGELREEYGVLAGEIVK
jgi:hypothetical protein